MGKKVFVNFGCSIYKRSLFLISFFIVFFIGSCTEEYISPLEGLIIDDCFFESAEDTFDIRYERLNFEGIEFNSTSPWCIAKGYNGFIRVKVLLNNGVEDRTASILAYDAQTNNTLSFGVNQRFSHEAVYKLLKVDSLSLSRKEKLYKPFMISDNEIHICVSKEDKLDSIKIYYTHNGDTAIIDSAVHDNYYDFSDFSNPHTIKLVSSKGIEKIYKINLYDLPVVTIETPDSLPIVSKKERKEGCTMNLYLTSGKMEDLGNAGIKGRGNSSWLQPKKPYNIKLDKKKEILGMKKSKHWLLLSNPFYDRTQLHNDVAFEIARMTDYKWVQSGKFVELILNGEHKGLYYLCEKVRIEGGKIDISEISPSDLSGDALTGGYLLECSNGPVNDYSFMTNIYNKTGDNWEYSLYWNFTSPEENIPTVQSNYIKNYINNLEELIANDSTLLSGEYLNYLDIESVINWWLVENLCINEEASRTKNLIVYKDRDSSAGGGKLTIGPPWDLDYGTFGMTGMKKLYVENNTWCYHRLLKDPYFISRLKDKWNIYYPLWKEEIPIYIAAQFDNICRSAKRNEILWPDWLDAITPFNNYEYKVALMENAFIEQINWMNNYISEL